jgi:ubiquinone/menaquinone biosynthesis C-methylase UbiE
MKQIQQSDYWNDSKIVKEFSEYEAPDYWNEAMQKDFILGKKLLDIGCGGGRNTLAAYKKGYEVSACDAHQEMVKATIQKLSNSGMDLGYAEQNIITAKFSMLPYENDNFDVVVSSGVLHNCDSMEEFQNGINEIARVLKKSGHLYLNVFIQGSTKNNLVPTEQDCVFLNSYGLPVLLLTQDQLLDMLANVGISPLLEQLHIYSSQINEGERTVLRGVFELQG